MTGLIQQYGILGVFLLMVPESAGIPVPSEVTLLFSGFAVSQHWMSFWLAVLAATAGNVVGSLIAYGIGATRLLARVPGARTLLGRWERMIDEQGLRAVFVARLLPLARTFVSLPAGARRLPLGAFTALTAAGCAIWAAAFVLIGLLSGSAWSAVSGVAGKVTLGAGIVVLGAAGWRRGRRGHRDPPSGPTPARPARR
ncbi:MAG: DedA family protein [Actinomycetota bacterium]|nr:DedA family protein [Actinomycetota bacterium]